MYRNFYNYPWPFSFYYWYTVKTLSYRWKLVYLYKRRHSRTENQLDIFRPIIIVNFRTQLPHNVLKPRDYILKLSMLLSYLHIYTRYPLFLCKTQQVGKYFEWEWNNQNLVITQSTHINNLRIYLLGIPYTYIYKIFILFVCLA